MRQRKVEVLTQERCVACGDRLVAQQSRDPGYIIVRQEPRGFFVKKSGRNEQIKPFETVESKYIADPVEHLAAHTSLT